MTAAVDGPDGTDDLLLDDLRRAVLRMDPPPPSLALVALGLLSWRDPDAELAALVADSRELAGAVRSGGHEVLLRFEGTDFALSIEASPDGSGRYRLIGQIEPGEAGAVEVRQDQITGPVVRCDEWGRFEAHPVTSGALSLRWTPDRGDGRPVHTAWVKI